MNFLEKLNFSSEQIAELEDTVPEKMKELLIVQKKLVIANLSYLKELGVTNYQDIFLKFYDIFLMDNSNFIEVFSKYETDDLIEKLNKNINIVEYL